MLTRKLIRGARRVSLNVRLTIGEAVLEEAKEVLKILIAWPTAAIVVVLVLRGPIKMLVERLIKSESGKAKVGPVEIELGKLAAQGQQAVQSLNRINYLMAESRLLELEITERHFGAAFSSEQRNRMQNQIEELRELTRNPTNQNVQ